MKLKPSITEYTEAEFLEFLAYLDEVNASEPDEVLDPLLDHFELVTEHPSGTDLLYWPTSPELSEPEAIIKIVKQWREENGKPGFKPG